MFISRLFKKPKAESLPSCIHKYELVKKVSREVDVNESGTYTIEDVYIYCPKCRTRKRVTPLEWELVQKEQKIDHEYMKRNGIDLERVVDTHA